MVMLSALLCFDSNIFLKPHAIKKVHYINMLILNSPWQNKNAKSKVLSLNAETLKLIVTSVPLIQIYF